MNVRAVYITVAFKICERLPPPTPPTPFVSNDFTDYCSVNDTYIGQCLSCRYSHINTASVLEPVRCPSSRDNRNQLNWTHKMYLPVPPKLRMP